MGEREEKLQIASLRSIRLEKEVKIDLTSPDQG
jgi:hypothetical protein